MSVSRTFVGISAIVAVASGCTGGMQSKTCPPCAQGRKAAVAGHGQAKTEGLSAEKRGPTDEGMWTFDAFPDEKVEKMYGFRPDKQWLQKVRLSSVRLSNGCSGSFVSGRGLVMTNHHCAHRCIQQVSNAKTDYIKLGFSAAAPKNEVACPGMGIDQLVAITDVTSQIMKAAEGKSDVAANEARKARKAKIEKECSGGGAYRCEVVSLYKGGKYSLYRYKRYKDVRLVFAPELATAFFGGDPDNFNFPRYDLDMSFLRVYEAGKPAVTEKHFAFSPHGSKAGELTFVSGNPGRTSRLLTGAQLAYQRDYALPSWLARYHDRRGALLEFRKLGKEQARVSGSALFGVENALKALTGMRQALVSPELAVFKRAEEERLKAAVAKDSSLAAEVGDAWGQIARAQAVKRELAARYVMLERGAGFWSKAFSFGRMLVRASVELPKANEKRLPAYTDAKVPSLKQRLFSTAPVNKEFEKMKLALSLTQMRERLGSAHPVVVKLLGKKTPEQVAREIVDGTKLFDVAVRKHMFEGGTKAISASDDPAIVLAKLVDPYGRKVRKEYEDRVEAVETKYSAAIARARFKIYGAEVYPDATFTPRLSFGHVEGWQEGSKKIAPYTTMGGAYKRNTGVEPYALPASWLKAKGKVQLDTPLDLCTTNDIIGGNSGSPMINKRAEIVGLIFDGNIHSLGGDYWYDGRVNRAVAVDSRAIVEALKVIYGADRLVTELTGAGK